MFPSRLTVILALAMFLIIIAMTNMAEGAYRKPPFNGSIFGKRANTNNNNNNDYDTSGKALSAMCEIAVEACQSWFMQENK